ncbi:MAG: polyphosphate polymerase domain-containing protein [Fibrobacter sp.]|nr:polyphosphate polymerase domain-containing protein [Fibrobacter sp.]
MAVEEQQKEDKKKTEAAFADVATPPVLDRFEVKYVIPFEMVEPIVEFIKPYCSHDKYSAISPDSFYKVNSLYFDTPNFMFLRQRLLRAEKRFNMRIRGYGDNPTFPFFFEIKNRMGDIVRKIRGLVDNEDFEKYFTIDPENFPESENKKNRDKCLTFYRKVQTYNAHPVVLVQYRRRAFFSNYDEYARVTFDIDLKYMEPPENSFRPIPDENKLSFCDNQGDFECGTYVILELKCYTSFVPSWMMDLVHKFGLKRRGFSKYSTCLRPLFSKYSESGLCRNPVNI